MAIITKIVTLSIETDEMPNEFKHADIIPLLKKKGMVRCQMTLNMLLLLYSSQRRV